MHRLYVYGTTYNPAQHHEVEKEKENVFIVKWKETKPHNNNKNIEKKKMMKIAAHKHFAWTTYKIVSFLLFIFGKRVCVCVRHVVAL